ncbi:hypothetical protein BKA70DRAFT_1225419 [Coprinopsis sp. MPI-PUGE-AT-0042]|nr:hypothetical protein BKA70DRAFT_1225419 [Coprinopsis sp. MPI-PUGE-AT-0042]
MEILKHFVDIRHMHHPEYATRMGAEPKMDCKKVTCLSPRNRGRAELLTGEENDAARDHPYVFESSLSLITGLAAPRTQLDGLFTPQRSQWHPCRRDKSQSSSPLHLLVVFSPLRQNVGSSSSQIVRASLSHGRLLATSTTLQNTPKELFALLNFICPEISADRADLDTYAGAVVSQPSGLAGKKEGETHLIMQLRKVTCHMHLFAREKPSPPYITDNRLVQKSARGWALIFLEESLFCQRRYFGISMRPVLPPSTAATAKALASSPLLTTRAGELGINLAAADTSLRPAVHRGRIG